MRKMSDQLIKMAYLNKISSINDYHDIPLTELIQEAVENNSDLVKEKDIHVDITISETTTVCVSKLFGLTIFSNVINNAIKYNVPSGWIQISSMESGNRVQISIKDSGIGIDADILDQIWNELFVCDSSRTDPVSKGLGLSMVKNLVTLHRGEISAHSEGRGKGTEVVIDLPCRCS